MTEYTMEIGKASLLLAYTKAGKLKRIEAKKGFLYADTLGSLVPSTEAEIKELAERSEYIKQVSNEKDPFFTTAQSYWLGSYKMRSGISYRFKPQCGKALKEIGVYLTQECGDTEKALQIWYYLCRDWDRLPEFYRNKPELTFVNNQLNTLLNLLKNGQTGSTRGSSAADDLRQGL